MTQCAIKIEDLGMTEKQAQAYNEVIQSFLEEIGFDEDRIEAFESRRRDGFIPYSHNKGGLEGRVYRLACEKACDTGFEKTDLVLEEIEKSNLEDFLKAKGLDALDWDNEKLVDEWYDYRNDNCDEYEAIEFHVRVMFTSDCTANVDFYISISDAPYYRQSDDRLELEVKFKSPKGLKQQLNRILKHEFVKKLSRNICW